MSNLNDSLKKSEIKNSAASNFCKEKILITGATSELGFQLSRKLLSLGADLVLTSRSQEKLISLKEKIKKNIDINNIDNNIEGKVTYLAVDLQNYETLKETLPKGITGVIHLVGGYNNSSIKNYTPEGTLELFKNIALSTSNLIDLIKDEIESNFIYISTIYTENISPTNTSYTTAKLVAESWLVALGAYLEKRNSSTKINIYKIKSLSNIDEEKSDLITITTIINHIIDNWEGNNLPNKLNKENRLIVDNKRTSNIRHITLRKEKNG